MRLGDLLNGGTSVRVWMGVCAAALLGGLASSSHGQQAGGPSPATAKVTVQFSAGMTTDQIGKLRDKLGVTSIQRVPALGAEIWTLSAPDVTGAASRIKGSTAIRSYEFGAGDYRALFDSTDASALPVQARMVLDRWVQGSVLQDVNVFKLHEGDLSTRLLVSGLDASDGLPAARSFRLNAVPGLDLIAQQSSLTAIGGGRFAWSGELTSNGKADPEGSATFVINGRSVSGVFTVGTTAYSVRSLGNGLQAVGKVDASRFPPDHPSTFPDGNAKLPSQAAQMDAGVGLAPQAVTPVISIAVAYTPSAANMILAMGPTVDDYIDTVVALTNKSFADSDIPARVTLAGTMRLTRDQSGNWAQDINALVGRTDGVWDEIHKWRKDVAANAVIVLVGATDSCGLSAAIGAKVDTAFSLVSAQCAEANYSLAHELGHLLGARHDQYTDTADTPYSFGHGYIYGNLWRTIMAYKGGGPCSSCGRLNRWANPNVMYHGVPTGTPVLNFDARVIRENAATMAAFRPN